MGYDVYTMSASARLSRHNDVRDDADNSAWNTFMDAVRNAARNSSLDIDVMGEGDLPTDRWGEDD